MKEKRFLGWREGTDCASVELLERSAVEGVAEGAPDRRGVKVRGEILFRTWKTRERC
jgi:hypothetical protein